MNTKLCEFIERQIGPSGDELAMLAYFANEARSFTLNEVMVSSNICRQKVEAQIKALVEYRFLSEEICNEIQREGDEIAFRITPGGKSYLARGWPAVNSPCPTA